MTRTATLTGIWNRALHRIGETQAIEADDERSAAAEACRVHYADALEEVLEALPWPFARRQEALSVPADVTRTGWDYIFNLPGDCVTPVALLGEGERIGLLQPRPFSTQGSYLLTNDDSFEVLEYTARIEDVTTFPRSFVDALAWRLAAELAMALRKDPHLASVLMEQYRGSLRTAGANAMNSQSFEGEPESSIVASRR